MRLARARSAGKRSFSFIAFRLAAPLRLVFVRLVFARPGPIIGAAEALLVIATRFAGAEFIWPGPVRALITFMHWAYLMGNLPDGER